MAEYSNRTDLQNPAAKIAATAAKGQTYGEAGNQIAAQRVVPMGAAPTDVAAAGAAPGSLVKPGSVVDLHAPTEFPNDMLNNNYTAPVPPATYKYGDPVLEELRQLYYLYPNDDLADLLSAYDRYFR